MGYNYYQISKKSSYAIIALTELAQKASDHAVNVKLLAVSQGVPLRFLEIILNELKQGGFVSSTRGKAGGYVLAAEPQNINVGSIIKYLDKHEDKSSDNISIDIKSNAKAVNDALVKINEAISDYFNSITLKDLAESSQVYEQCLSVDYVI